MLNIFKKLNQLLDLMLEERESRKQERVEREQEKADKELREYVRSKQKEIDPPLIQSSGDDQDRPVKTKAPILIPFGLSEDERTILEDFYNDDR
jgi:hypothetical protein